MNSQLILETEAGGSKWKWPWFLLLWVLQMSFPLMFCICSNAPGVVQDIGCEQLKGLISQELIRFCYLMFVLT